MVSFSSRLTLQAIDMRKECAALANYVYSGLKAVQNADYKAIWNQSVSCSTEACTCGITRIRNNVTPVHAAIGVVALVGIVALCVLYTRKAKVEKPAEKDGDSILEYAKRNPNINVHEQGEEHLFGANPSLEKATKVPTKELILNEDDTVSRKDDRETKYTLKAVTVVNGVILAYIVK